MEQPCRLDLLGQQDQNHPRAHGATWQGGLYKQYLREPSPRAWSNRAMTTRRSGCGGTIPARMEQPATSPALSWRRGNHPRAHGATTATPWAEICWREPSPRAWSNRGPPEAAELRQRTIPARMEQPTSTTTWTSTRGNHPRAHGATPKTTFGASPYVNGTIPHARVFSEALG